MRSYLPGLKGFSFLLFSVVLMVVPTSAQTNSYYSFGSNLGELDYTTTTLNRSCTSEYGVINYTNNIFSNFVYNNSQAAISQPISGSTFALQGIGGRLLGSGNCPKYRWGDTITYNDTTNGSAYTIVINPEAYGVAQISFATITVPGYVNPKYVVLSVIYAPPQPSSSETYGSSSLESKTNSLTNSYKSGYTVTVSNKTNWGIYAYVDGGLDSSSTVSSSTTESTESTTTESFSITKGSGVTDTVYGPKCPSVGVDHDYDIIKLWVNPVLLFTLTNNHNNPVVQWNGYGYSSLDTIANGGDLQVPDMDIQYVYVGCLNGDFDNLSPGYCSNQYGKAFARTWARVEGWPSGQGPGLTGPGTTAGTDLNNIAQADPYWNCTYQSGEGANACSFNSARYTRVYYNGSPLPPFPYNQAPPGGQPTSQTYNEYITTASTTGQGVTNVYSYTFGWENTFGGSIFKEGFTDTISQTQTLTSTDQWNNQFTSSNTVSAAATIYTAPCNVVNGQCTPPYPPGQAYQPVACSALNLPTAFGQGTSFLLYLDNLYGTFMMLPESY